MTLMPLPLRNTWTRVCRPGLLVLAAVAGNPLQAQAPFLTSRAAAPAAAATPVQAADLSVPTLPIVANASVAGSVSPSQESSSLAATDAGVSSAADLPDAPTPQIATRNTPPPPNTPQAQHVVPLHEKYVPAGWRAQPLDVHDKIVMGAKDLYSIDNFGAMFVSAGYSHITDGQPNYGVDKKAFGQRLGSAAVRETAQGIFTDMVFAPLLHEDSRYFQKGPQFNPVRRTIYAITRPLITRTDSGRETINGALLLGYAATTALTPAFYPQSNRNFHDAASSYAGSIGGAALGFFVTEFADDVLETLHLKRTP